MLTHELNVGRAWMANRRPPWATAAIAALALGAYLWPKAADVFAFNRDGILAGEIWRLWTGHLVHFTGAHLAWNLAVFVAAGGWAERVAPRATHWFYALAPAIISMAVILFEPGLQTYAGLSGVGAGTLVLLAVARLRTPGADRVFWVAVLVLLAAKIVLEFVHPGPVLTRFESSAIQPVPLAHVAGVVCAVGVSYFRGRRGS